MQHRDILPVLYDLSVTIGGEINLKSLLTRTLQRLLYHTSFSAGFICLDHDTFANQPGNKRQANAEVRIDSAVGDYDLIGMIGKLIMLPCELVCGGVKRESGQAEMLARMEGTPVHYRSFFRLPIEGLGVIVLLATHEPESDLPLTQMLQPVLAHLAKAIVLCRNSDAQIATALVKQEKIQQSLEQLESDFRALIELSPIGVAFSSDGIMMDGSATFLRMFGYADISELRGKPLIGQIAPQQREQMIERIGLRAQGVPVENIYETVGLRKDGTQFPFMVSAKRVETKQGARTFSFFIDLTEQKRTEQALRSSNEMLRSILETAPLRIFWKDIELRYLGCNTAFARDAGMSHLDELVGKDDFQMGWSAQAELYRDDDRRVMSSDKPILNFEEPQTTPDGRQTWLRTSKVPLHDNEGKVIGVLGIYDDITERKHAEAQIHQLAFYDTLTELPNRRLMRERLQKAAAASTRSGIHGALLILDLDDFKTLNDTKGHNIGDMLLVEVAKRMCACVRDGDTVARLGGDEFVVILEALSAHPAEAAARAEQVAEKIRGALNEPYLLSGQVSQISTSIGVVLFIDHKVTLEELLKYADTAMYQAKSAGRNTIRFYDPQMQSELEERLKLLEDLRCAIEREELQLYFQKQVDSTGRIIGAEVLLRWQHPLHGLVMPNQFIPLAESNGLIVLIGQWVVHNACEQLKAWQHYPHTRDLVLAVNVSAKQFRQNDFVVQVQRALLDTGARAFRLKLEMTESTVLENVADTIAKMRDLKVMGVSFSMDDFGTGYSSLQYIKRLPLDQIKIDQSFVRDITTDPNDAAIVRTIIAMTEALGLDVIAEGVETIEQQEFLDQNGCHAFQGYLFGKAVPIAQFEEALRDRRS